MSASLVGSEMCIRDSPPCVHCRIASCVRIWNCADPGKASKFAPKPPWGCLLYTSDAADDM
eukprot:10442407-Alexandrium_andersonii.AAC.1